LGTDVFDGFGACIDAVADKSINDCFCSFCFSYGRVIDTFGIYSVGSFVKDFQVFERWRFDDTGAHAVFKVVAVVSDSVGDVCNLSFEGAVFFGEVTTFGAVISSSVFCQAESGFIHEIQTREIWVWVFEYFDNSQSLPVVLETSEFCHKVVEGIFTGVSERRVSEVMGERYCLGEAGVQAEVFCDGSCNLSDFDAVSKSGSVVVVESRGEDLCFSFESSESGAMNNSVTVSFEVGAIGVWFFRCYTTSTCGFGNGVRSEFV